MALFMIGAPVLYFSGVGLCLYGVVQFESVYTWAVEAMESDGDFIASCLLAAPFVLPILPVWGLHSICMGLQRRLSIAAD